MPGAYRANGLVLAAFISGLLRMIPVLLLGPLTLPDSVRYLSGIDAFGLAGNPSPVVQSVWLAPDAVSLAAQCAASGFAWGLLAVVVGRLCKPGRQSWACTLGVLAWSWCPLALSYDAAVMSESLAASGTLTASTAMVILAVRRPDGAMSPRASYLIFLVGATVAMLARPITIVLILPLALVVLILLWRRKHRRLPVALAGAALGVAAMWSVVAQTNAEQQNAGLYASNALAWRATPTYLALAEKDGMPSCRAFRPASILRLVTDSSTFHSYGPLRLRTPSRRFLYDRALLLQKCPNVAEWIRRGKNTEIAWLLKAPAEPLAEWVGDSLVQARPRALLPWTSRALDVESLSRMAVTVLASLTLLLTLVRFTRRLWGRPDGGADRRAVTVAAVMLASWLAYSFITWFSDASEVPRHFLPVPLIAAPLSLLMILAVRKSATAHRNERRVEHSAADSAATSEAVLALPG